MKKHLVNYILTILYLNRCRKIECPRFVNNEFGVFNDIIRPEIVCRPSDYFKNDFIHPYINQLKIAESIRYKVISVENVASFGLAWIIEIDYILIFHTLDVYYL